MSDKLDQYVDGVFAPYEGAKSISELKADLLADLHERFRELKAEGKDDTAAFELTIDSIGREDVDSASGPASPILTEYGRRVGSLGPGLACESADALSGCPANRSAGRGPGFFWHPPAVPA